jgi:hypothetical protein
MAVELKNKLEGDLQVSVPLLLLIQGPTVAELAGSVLAQIAPDEAGVPAAPIAPPERPTRGAEGPLLLALMDLREDDKNA